MFEFGPIPLADLNRQCKTLEREIYSEICKVTSSADFINGPAVGEFEEKFSALVGLKHGVGVNSGTDALTLSVLALSLNPGDEVITVPYTWISTAFAISHAGATPVFVDVDVDTHQMDPKKLRLLLPRRQRLLFRFICMVTRRQWLRLWG